jgi:hypothetical protein
MFTSIRQWLVVHRSAILATIVVLQNSTGFGRQFKGVFDIVGQILVGMSN